MVETYNNTAQEVFTFLTFHNHKSFGKSNFQSTPLDTIQAFRKEIVHKDQQTLAYKLYIKPFHGIWLRLIAFILGLSHYKLAQMRENDFATYEQIDACGLYRLMCQ